MTSSVQSLSHFRSPKQRFARSINVERDAGSAAINGYLPVGRALDTVHRIAGCLLDNSVERAFSITGPYGSGKSSLAVLLDALFAPASDEAFATVDGARRRCSPGNQRPLEAGSRGHGRNQDRLPSLHGHR